ncbi:NADH-quinone oxidoreductase subunit NuoG [Kangiella sediminilitoris]|uniref:NADH-quinone oxidoreductase n=1 Tax=Kangiella sediminilitoris TaxID=1144748 RepID=A0A1B3BDA2_9GAMM|nr:NADH-quinone oxidoreductase subunit NuoG [Kangiella sediminilitoris]AOE50814.1 NADH-quinone oxidoreductase, chain G [Kangiella sediminilitoris]
MVSIEIDGKKIEAEQGAMIIEVADANGITIPRFCYHKKLSIAANCRMCLVEVDGSKKPLPACATPISDGMVVKTQSEFAQDSQKSVMEFLLINHPLDCPICDQGGECELQDVALEYGKDVSRFSEKKRAVVDEDLGPLIETEMTRCIHCTRCVRFGREVAGIRELGAVGRGEHMEISTFIEQSVDSEVSGNIIDLCPVGALTAKPSRYQARSWEMAQRDSVSPHDCIGANLHVHTLRNRVIRVVPKENEEVNEVWLADRDRYSYEALTQSERLLKPMIRQNGNWQEVDWETALERAASKLNMMAQTDGADQIAAIAHPSSTTEEMYLLQKVIRGLGSNNIDHRLRTSDFTWQKFEPLHPELGVKLSELDSLDSCLLIGANLRKEQPLASLRVRKATRHGDIASIGLYPVYHNFNLKHEIITDAETWLGQLAAIAKYLLERQNESEKEHWSDAMDLEQLENLVAHVPVKDEHKNIAEMLLQSDKSSIILGASALEFSYAGHLRLLSKAIANLSGSSYGFFPHGGNSVGAYLAGAIPHRGPAGADVEQDGQHIKDLFEQGKKAYVLLKTEPGKESVIADKARQSLEQADFVISMTCHADDEAFEYADIILPVASFLETSGSYVNLNGTWQDFSAAVNAPAEAKPAWKVLRVLGNLLNLKNFDYVSAEEVRKEVKGRLSAVGDRIKPKWQCPESLPKNGFSPRPVNMYQIDGWLRRAPSLQATALAQGREILKRPRLSPFHNIVGGV